MPEHRQIQITLSGCVQGVGFRYYTMSMATSVGVCGYVQNKANGTVFVLAEGPEDVLRYFLRRVEIGPPHAQVEHIVANWQESKGAYNHFSIK